MDSNEVAKFAIDTHRHHQQEGNRAYFEWVRTCLTVASGSLALLVALQGSFLPAAPRFLWLLQAAWGCLVLAILAALVTLRSESAAHFRAANSVFTEEFVKDLQRGDLVKVGLDGSDAPWYYRIFQSLLSFSFAASFIFLGLFAILNVGGLIQHVTP